MSEIILWGLAVYLVIGIGVTFLLSNTPYADNSWIHTTILWPLFVYVFLTR